MSLCPIRTQGKGDRLKKSKRDKTGLLATALLVLGAAAVSIGAGLIFPPAGFIAGGLLAIAAGVLTALGEGGDDG